MAELIAGWRSELDAPTFNKFRRIVFAKSGIRLKAGKEALVSARVAKRMRALGIDTHRAYLKYLMADETGDEVVLFLDAISTNVTSFFREPDHFEFLKDLITAWRAERRSRLRFWSAACSSGEEPYTIAITALEALQGAATDVRILATDLSTRILDRCREARYPTVVAKQSIPALFLQRYFDQVVDDRKQFYVPKPALQRMLVVRRLNLSVTPFPMKGPLDAIFCRNVMIYLDNAVRERLLEEAYRLLRPGGYLFVGHVESLVCVKTDFKVVRPSIYVKEG